MTEQEWLTRPAPRKLLEHLEECGGASERKLRLFAAACCRQVRNWFNDPCQDAAVIVLESFADGKVSVGELEAARLAVDRINREVDVRSVNMDSDRMYLAMDLVYHAWEVLSQATCYDHPGGETPRLIDRAHDIVINTLDVANLSAEFNDRADGRALLAEAAERETLCELLRCIFGNPFRPVVFDLSWRTETAVALATGIYEERTYDRLPILADALEEAGCDNADVLSHCRGRGPHARGCWAVDGVMGKS